MDDVILVVGQSRNGNRVMDKKRDPCSFSPLAALDAADLDAANPFTAISTHSLVLPSLPPPHSSFPCSIQSLLPPSSRFITPS
jgi:hypothetical protein